MLLKKLLDKETDRARWFLENSGIIMHGILQVKGKYIWTTKKGVKWKKKKLDFESILFCYYLNNIDRQLQKVKKQINTISFSWFKQ